MEEEEKSWRDARSNVRTGLGLGFEIAANTGLDIFSFVPGSQQAGSAFINYLAQRRNSSCCCYESDTRTYTG